MLKLFVDGHKRHVTFKTFPAGESMVRIDDSDGTNAPGCKRTIRVEMQFQGNDDIINLALLVDAVRRHFDVGFLHLDMPYLPYARQDRVCSEGESLSVKVIADIINALKFDRVWCIDIHSDTGAALLDNLVHTKQLDAASELQAIHPEAVLVAPDAGALKKVHEFARGYSYEHVVCAGKVRDPRTGAITGTKVYDEVPSDADLLVLDDICDGGRTFIELAKVLRPLTTGKLYLYVTHGIFSQGLEDLCTHYDRVYVVNHMSAYHHPHLTAI